MNGKRNNLKVGINDANGYNLSSQYTNLEVYAGIISFRKD